MKKKGKTEYSAEQLKDDSPITNIKDDMFGLGQFVQNLANALIPDNKNSDKSKVIALTGGWGVGKTSVINMVKEVFSQMGKKNLYFINFYPWQYTDKNDLIKPFLEEFYLACKEKRLWSIKHKIAKYYKVFDLATIKDYFVDLVAALSTLIGFIVSIKKETDVARNIYIPVEYTGTEQISELQILLYLIPILLFAFLFIFSFCKLINAFLRNNLDTQKVSALNQKKEISKYIEKKDKHFIIIIDDIDRLTPKETLQIFRIVRSNADFANTTYLLSFDKEVIIKNLQNEQIKGEDFIEKIITTEYKLHAPASFYIRNCLNKELNYLVHSNNKWQEDIQEDNYKFGQVLYLLSLALVTMRDIKRYLNSLSLHSKNVINGGVAEVNFIDLLIVECFMLYYRDTYYGIQNNKGYMLSTSRDSVKNELQYLSDQKEFVRKEDEYKKSINEYIKGFCKTELELKMLMWLFPNLYFAFENELNLSLLNYRPNQVVRNNICVPNSFDFYFTSGINLDDPEHITNRELQEFSGTSAAKDSMISYFKKCNKNGKFELLIEILRDACKTKSFIPLKNASPFVSAMFDAQCLLPRKQRLYFTKDTRGICKEIISSYLKQYSQNSKDILLDAIKQTDNLYPLLSFLFDQQQKLDVMNSDVVINQNEFVIIKKAVFEKVTAKYKNDHEKFFKDDDLEEIINYWYHIDNVHFEKITKSETSSVKKLCEIMICLYKQRNNREEYYYPYGTTGYFGDLDNFKLRLEKALKNKTLDSRNKIIAQYYIDNWQNRDLQLGMSTNDDVKQFDKEREMEEENATRSNN